MSVLTMTSNQPYLLKAFFDWIVDNELTPHLVVDATMDNVRVPLQYVNDGQIVLNVSPSACMNFHMSPEGVSFQARFGGQPHYIDIPCSAVLAIYARENGAGTVFTPDTISEESDDITIPEEDNQVETLQSAPKELVEVKSDTPKDNAPSKTKKDRKRPVFTVVK
jgi:stringent starvation protein B